MGDEGEDSRQATNRLGADACACMQSWKELLQLFVTFTTASTERIRFRKTDRETNDF